MPRTAPAAGAADPVSFWSVQFRFIDARGDKRSVSAAITTAGLTYDDVRADANVLANELGAASNANLYELAIRAHYADTPLAGSAVDDVFTSVDDNIVILYKNPTTLATTQMYIPAPVDFLVLNGEVVDTNQALYIAVRDATTTLLVNEFDPISARFTERRDKNDATPA